MLVLTICSNLVIVPVVVLPFFLDDIFAVLNSKRSEIHTLGFLVFASHRPLLELLSRPHALLELGYPRILDRSFNFLLKLERRIGARPRQFHVFADDFVYNAVAYLLLDMLLERCSHGHRLLVVAAAATEPSALRL